MAQDWETWVGSGSLAIISEFDLDTPWSVGRAMQRNGTICALGEAMFVIEAGTSGGTLAAGRTALKLGIPLFAIQYPDRSPGNQLLIAEGATPLTHDSQLRAVLRGEQTNPTVPRPSVRE